MNRRTIVKNFWEKREANLYEMFLNVEAFKLNTLDLPEVLQILPPFRNFEILDLAAGIGRFTTEFAKEAKRVTAVDLSPAFIEENRKINQSFQNIDWILSDALDLHFSPGSFDLIFISWMLMYLEDEEVKILSAKMRQWLKPGGFLFFRESCAARTLQVSEYYYANYRSLLDYDRFFSDWNVLNTGHIQAYEQIQADPFKCYWLLQNEICCLISRRVKIIK